jgi:hypothetical protein
LNEQWESSHTAFLRRVQEAARQVWCALVNPGKGTVSIPEKPAQNLEDSVAGLSPLF